MIEGGTTKNFAKVKGMMFDQPQLMHTLLDKVAQSVVSYLNAQIEAGAQAVMVFDTWGGILTQRDYLAFSLVYMQKIVSQLKREHEGQTIPVILFTKGGGQWLHAMADTGCDALGLDWTLPIGEARQQVGDKVALQGNMDPCILYASPQRIEQEVKTILESFGQGEGHVFNLGHGIHPEIDPEHVAAFINAVHEYSKQYHAG
jgi:uroporphyrinogen decarboxylase